MIKVAIFLTFGSVVSIAYGSGSWSSWNPEVTREAAVFVEPKPLS